MRTVFAILLLTSAVIAEMPQCLDDLVMIGKQMMNFTGSDPHSRMAQFTGRKLNDLGDYKACSSLDYAEYILISLDPEISLYFAICSPKNCTMADYQEIIYNLSPTQTFVHEALFAYQPTEIKAISTWFKSKQDPSNPSIITADVPDIEVHFPMDEIQNKFAEYTLGTYLMIFTCVVFGALMVVGTMLDLAYRNKKQSSSKETSESGLYLLNPDFNSEPGLYSQILISFSLYTNTQKLFVARNAGRKETLDIFNGIRVLSMSWVVLGHVFAQRMKFSAILNLEVIFEWLREPKGLLIYGAFFSVDTFFWISGFLIAYIFLSEYSSKGRMNFKQVYFHRFYRIMPPFLMSFCLSYAFPRYAGDGPMYVRGDFMDEQCEGVWWSNIVFLNNFVPNGDGNKCFIHGWYLANDMQFFLITPLILHVYHAIDRKLGWGCILGVIVTNVICTLSIADYHGASVGGANSLWESFETIYTKPYCRIGAYIVGVIFGMLYFNHKYYESNDEIYDPYALSITSLLDRRIFRLISYNLGSTLINYILYVQYYAYHSSVSQPDLRDDMTQASRNMFLAFSRLGYGLGMGCVLLPVLMGHGTLLYNFLAANFWTPFARLSFCGYLVHMPIFFVLFMNEPTGIFYDNQRLFLDFVALLMITWFAAYLLCMAVESPSMAIERIWKNAAQAKKRPTKPEGIELSS